MKKALSAIAVLLALGALVPVARSEPNAPLTVGQKARDFGLRAIDLRSGELGAMHWLSDFVGKEAKTPQRAVVLSFFATWCKPCVGELAALRRLRQRFVGRGLEVLAINVRARDEDPDAALRESHALMQALQLDFPVLFDRYTVRNAIVYVGDTVRLPCNVVVDGEGTIVERVEGASATAMQTVEAAIEPLLRVPEAAPVLQEKL